MMAKKPSRTWTMVASLGIPLAIVGVSAMAISYATLIDVARVNGLPLPELFPVLVDVGTVATMIAAAQFRLRGLSGRWLAYTTFILLSGVSIVANATHAGRAADLTVTTPWAAAILAATPPAALLAITHLVMMLVPDEKERAKMQALREQTERKQAVQDKRQQTERAAVPPKQFQSQTPLGASTPRHEASPAAVQSDWADSGADDTAPIAVATFPTPLHLVERTQVTKRSKASTNDSVVLQLVMEHIETEGKRPTGVIVGEWLGGQSSKSGQRFINRYIDQISNAEEQKAVNS